MEQDRSGNDEANSSMDSIIVSFSNLLRQLDNDDDTHLEGSNSNSPGSASFDRALLRLEKLHEEITEIQGEIEKFQLFKEGQDLYTKWLYLLEQIKSCKGKNRKNDQSNAIDLNGDIFNKHAEKFRELIAISCNNRGYLKYLQVDFKGALEDYTAALKHNPTLACAYYNRGLVTYRLAFFDQAVQDMKTAVGLDPNKEEFHEGLKNVSEMVGSSTEHKFRLEFGTGSSDNGQDL